MLTLLIIRISIIIETKNNIVKKLILTYNNCKIIEIGLYA